MNKGPISAITEMLKTKSPKIENLSQEDRKFYRSGLLMLGICVPDNFFDIPQLPHHNYINIKDGLYYSVCYFDDKQLWSMDNKRSLLAVYKIEGGSSFCPFSMECQHSFLGDGSVDPKNFKIICNDQSGDRTIKKNLLHVEDGVFYTQIPNHMQLTLSQLMVFSNHENIK